MTEHVFYHEHVFGVKSQEPRGFSRSVTLRACPNGFDKLLGRVSAKDEAEEARSEAAIDTDRVDAASSRVMGVYGDIGPTVPNADSPDDNR